MEKWYKCLNRENQYRKGYLNSNGNIEYKERINYDRTGKYETIQGTAYWNNNSAELTDLTEIQQYLPEGHVDKIKNNEIILW